MGAGSGLGGPGVYALKIIFNYLMTKFSKGFFARVILRVIPTACRQSFSGGARISTTENGILREYPQNDKGTGSG